MSQETITLTIDGKEVTVPQGTLLIRAAEELGIVIPRFCDHPLLDPVGACRQCVVEVEGQRKPMMSCTTPVQDGMEVRTHLTSDVARKAQEGTLEFLLINHPLDCPMCDKGGECPLQDQALAHGSNVSRFVDEKRRYQKPVAVSELVLLDRERCVLCARCTRFSEQISGDPFIELFERGALEQVAIYEDEPYRSYFSGNVIQICPVGALTSSDYRFKARPFDTRSAPSVCDHCSAGCTFTVQSRRGEIQRQLARTNMDVNEMWSCDKGRFGFAHLVDEQRLTAPQVRDGDGLAEVTWAEALERATTAIADARDKGEGRVAVLTGSRLADEDAYAVAKFARTVLGTDDVDHRTTFSGAGRTDETVALVGRDGATYADVEAAPVTLVVGLDPEEEVPILFLRLRKAWRDRRSKLVPVGPRMGSLAPYAWRRLPSAPGEELAALAALGRALGLADLAPMAVDAGYEADAVETVARELRTAEQPPVVLVGERAPVGAVTIAAKIAAQTDARVAYVPRRAGAPGALRAGLAAGVLPGGRRLDDPDDRAAVEDAWGEIPAQRGRDLHAILEAAAGGDIDVLHLAGVDLARDCEDPELAAKALRRATVICQDLARTETTEQADIVLPVAGTQERSGTLTDWEGRSQRFRPAVDAPDLAQEDWKIVVQLAARLGVDLGFSDLDQLRADREALGVRDRPHDWPGVPRDGDGSGPGHGAAANAGAGGGDDADDDGTPLQLLAYPRLLGRGTMLAGAANLLATAPQAAVAVHPDDADALDVVAGGRLRLVADAAEVELPVVLDEGLTVGTVYAPTDADPDVRLRSGAVSVTVIDDGRPAEDDAAAADAPDDDAAEAVAP